MTLITDIRKDREAGTPGDWFVDGGNDWPRAVEPDVLFGCGCCGSPNLYIVDARRIARVPKLEEIALAAERLMHCATVANDQRLISDSVSTDLAVAIAHTRDLLEGGK